MPMNQEQWQRAVKLLRTQRLEPDITSNCPVCGGGGLRIADRSARPHAEWYQLDCDACGLSEAIHIPLAPPMGG